MSSPNTCFIGSVLPRVQNTDQVGRHVQRDGDFLCGKRKGGDYIVTPKINDARKDQLKLASLSSGVEVALVVSASINWGKRCPHFLAAGGGVAVDFFAVVCLNHRVRVGHGVNRDNL